MLSASSLSEGPCIINNKMDFALAKGSSKCLVKHSIVGERTPSRLCVRHGVEAGGLLRATIAMTHPTHKFRRVLRLQALHRGPSIVSSCETSGHYTNAMAPSSCITLNLTIALFITALARFWRSCRSVFPRCAWEARESFDWTRGIIPTHTPPAPRLVCLSSISPSGWVANGSSHCSRCSSHPPPCPPSSPQFSLPPRPPSPPPPPASTSRVPIPLP